MSIEALKLARDELYRVKKICLQEAGIGLCNEVVLAAIDQAIEQAQKQEPVAWMDGPHLIMRTDWRDKANYKGPWVDLGRAIPDAWKPVLYTSPPQRQPLTDEQIRQVMQSLGWTGEAPSDIEFARAIEAAHGITGEQK